MGLDTVELVIKVEETFDIKIDDRDAEKILTVGMLNEYVSQKVAVKEDAPCLSSATFYRLRRAFTAQFGVERGQIRPAFTVAALLPDGDHREHWRRLGAAAGLELPDLVRPAVLRSALEWVTLCACLLTILFVFVAAVERGAFAGVLFLATVASIASSVLGYLWTRPLAIEIGPSFQTVRQLVPTVIGLNADRLVSREYRWSRSEVREMLRAIIIEQLGVKPEEVTDEARFVDDLGAG